MAAERVLLIDDDPKVLRLLEATLRLKDYDVVKMESGVDALAWLKRQQPDLIISDIMMPDLDGYDFFRRVKASTDATRIPFIFLSARSEPEDVVKGLRLGADEFLRKPFSIDELLVRVERVLERSGGGPKVEPSRGVFEGDLQHMALSDVIRMLAVQRKTGLLRVDPQRVVGSGAVQLVEGQAMHAEFGALEGEPALFQLLVREAGRFSFRPGEELPGRTIEIKTLPLLMEAYRLIDLGVLRRIDPHNLVAGATLARLVTERRKEVGPLPLIEEDTDKPRALGLPGMALRLTKGRPPGGAEPDDPAGISLEEPDFSDTVQVATADVFSDDELDVLRELRHGGPGPDTWDAAGLIDEPSGADLASPTEEDPLEGLDALDSMELAPGFLTSELEAIEEELGLSDRPAAPEDLKAASVPGSPPPIHEDSVDEPAPKLGASLEVPPVTQPTGEAPPPFPDLPLDPDQAVTAVPEPEPVASSGRIYVTTEVKAIALVDDTAYEVPTVETDPGTDRLMDLYERLKAVASKDLGTRQVQMGTRSGRVIAGTVEDAGRRATVAAFSAQAISFASEGPMGLQFASLDAGDLHVLVVETDHLRLFTLLFDRKPEPVAVLDAIGPVVLAWREAR